MTENLHSIPSAKQIEHEASDWLIKLDREQPLSDAERRQLAEWLNRSPQHRHQLNSLVELWGGLNVLTELAVPLEKPAVEKPAVAEQHKSAKSLGDGLGALLASWFMRNSFISVYSVLLVVVGIFLISTNFRGSAVGNGFYVTAVGQQDSATLADGSVVQLNTNSQIEVVYSKAFRDIYLLRGEAHFEVAKDSKRPFRVYAGDNQIQAIGTAFSVYLREQDVNVTVSEGEVALAMNAPSASVPEIALPVSKAALESNKIEKSSVVAFKEVATLTAGQTTDVQRNHNGDEQTAAHVTAIDEEELSRRLSWREGFLVFSGEPLEHVVNEISRYTTVSIDIQDLEVRNIKIGGRFKIGETDAMLESLQENFALQVTRLSYNRVRLSSSKI